VPTDDYGHPNERPGPAKHATEFAKAIRRETDLDWQRHKDRHRQIKVGRGPEIASEPLLRPHGWHVNKPISPRQLRT
jgi:hypothetical protein